MPYPVRPSRRSRKACLTMADLTVIAVGGLREDYFRRAADEYKKRLSSSFNVREVEIKEEKLPSSPSDAEIANALDREAERIIAAVPKRAFTAALCVEGEELSSGELSSRLSKEMSGGVSSFCFIVGSSHGLSDKVKRSCAARLSMSRMTFPHQLARVMLFEALYRAAEIMKGTGYHK